MSQETITLLIGTFTLAAHVGLVIVLVAYFFFKNKKKCGRTLQWIGVHGIFFAFLMALASVLGSLYYSEIARLAPCDLCWYQRIFMYPLVFLLGLALYKRRDKKIIPYALLLSIVGGLIALYHSLIQAFQTEAVTCSINSHISCSETYFVLFGYISIPVISLTAFILVIVSLLFAKKYD